jgi:hypothetical protein
VGERAPPRARAGDYREPPLAATVGADTLDRSLGALLVGVEDADPPPLDIPIVTELRLPDCTPLRWTSWGRGSIYTTDAIYALSAVETTGRVHRLAPHQPQPRPGAASRTGWDS